MRFTPKIVLVVAGCIVMFVVVALGQEMNRRWQVQREVRKLESEIRSMENKLIALEQLNQYFRTPDYLERVAREKLNYHAPGEQVVLIPEAAGETASPDVGVSSDPSIPVWQRWWEIFFVEEAPLRDMLAS